MREWSTLLLHTTYYILKTTKRREFIRTRLRVEFLHHGPEPGHVIVRPETVDELVDLQSGRAASDVQ